jgi:hypothetical protein
MFVIDAKLLTKSVSNMTLKGPLYSSISPHTLEFASAAWSPWNEGDKAILEKIQRRAVSWSQV